MPVWQHATDQHDGNHVDAGSANALHIQVRRLPPNEERKASQTKLAEHEINFKPTKQSSQDTVAVEIDQCQGFTAKLTTTRGYYKVTRGSQWLSISALDRE